MTIRAVFIGKHSWIPPYTVCDLEFDGREVYVTPAGQSREPSTDTIVFEYPTVQEFMRNWDHVEWVDDSVVEDDEDESEERPRFTEDW